MRRVLRLPLQPTSLSDLSVQTPPRLQTRALWLPASWRLSKDSRTGTASTTTIQVSRCIAKLAAMVPFTPVLRGIRIPWRCVPARRRLRARAGRDVRLCFSERVRSVVAVCVCVCVCVCNCVCGCVCGCGCVTNAAWATLPGFPGTTRHCMKVSYPSTMLLVDIPFAHPGCAGVVVFLQCLHGPQAS